MDDNRFKIFLSLSLIINHQLVAFPQNKFRILIFFHLSAEITKNLYFFRRTTLLQYEKKLHGTRISKKKYPYQNDTPYRAYCYYIVLRLDFYMLDILLTPQQNGKKYKMLPCCASALNILSNMLLPQP